MNFLQLHERLRIEMLRRIERGVLTPSMLARQTRFVPAHISNFLNCKRMLSLNALDKVLLAQGLTVADLLGPTAPDLRDSSRLRYYSIPLVANSGPKGPVVKALARRAGKPVFFMDDVPMHHASVAELTPEVFRIHFVGDERLKPLMPSTPHAHFRADNWTEAQAFITARLEEG